MLALLCDVLDGNVDFTLRATALHPFLRGILRFSISGHPEALVACYVAS